MTGHDGRSLRWEACVRSLFASQSRRCTHGRRDWDATGFAFWKIWSSDFGICISRGCLFRRRSGFDMRLRMRLRWNDKVFLPLERDVKRQADVREGRELVVFFWIRARERICSRRRWRRPVKYRRVFDSVWHQSQTEEKTLLIKTAQRFRYFRLAVIGARRGETLVSR